MLNALDAIRSDPTARRFEIGEILFAQFTCPADDAAIGVWSQTDWLVHVLSAQASWKTTHGVISLDAGQSAFFRKGGFIMPPHVATDLCLLIFFIPDAFVRETVRELATDLPVVAEPFEPREPAIPVETDVALAAFFQSMTTYFAGSERPPEALLKLKLRELLTSILVGRNNAKLSAYLRFVAAHAEPPIPVIMEANFRHNLALEVFAQMCHRSLSSFKREFREHYGTPPGKWLLDRRLECAAQMLRSTRMSVTEIVFECGFEEASHFSRAFRAKFGQTPSEFRKATGALV